MDAEDDREYVVVANEEEQYSIWLSHKAIPQGWRDQGFRGSRAACLDFIEIKWTDMRPLSLRKAMARSGAV